MFVIEPFPMILVQTNFVNWLAQYVAPLWPLSLAALVALHVGFHVYFSRLRAARRREVMEAFASEHGWQFHPRAHPSLLKVTDGFRAVYSSEINPRIENVISRSRHGVTVALFDFCFSRPQGERWAQSALAAIRENGLPRGTLRRRSVACVWSDTLRLPYFTVRRKEAVTRLLGRLGAQDIEFEECRLFSELYWLSGENEGAVRALFSRDLLEFFTSRTSLREHDIMVEGENNCLMLHPRTVNLPPADLTWLIDETEAVFGALLRSQRSRMRKHDGP